MGANGCQEDGEFCRQEAVQAFTSSPALRRRRIGHLVGLGLFLTVLVLWLISAFGRPELLDRDWVAFDNAGWRALSGNWSSVYTASADEKWAYLYPPFAVPLAVPLGLLPYFASYALVVAMGLGGLMWSCRRLGTIADAGDGRFLVFCSALLCAPTTLQVLITGQYSWLYLVALVGAASYWEQGDDRRAGWCLALLAVKPNLAVLILPLLAVRRCRGLARHAGSAVLAAVVVTLPVSIEAWPRFVDAVRTVATVQEQGNAPMEKQITLLSFLRVVAGNFDGSAVTWVLWCVLGVALAAVTLHAWRRADDATPALRLVGMAALAMVALSPRLYFYDGLIVAAPAASWYLRRDGYTLRPVRRLEGLCLLGIGVVTALFFPWPAVSTAFGPLAGTWLALEAADVLAGVRARSRSGPAEAPLSDATTVGSAVRDSPVPVGPVPAGPVPVGPVPAGPIPAGPIPAGLGTPRLVPDCRQPQAVADGVSSRARG